MSDDDKATIIEAAEFINKANDRFIGNINPHGDSSLDHDVRINVVVAGKVLGHLTDKIARSAQVWTYEGSVQAVSNEALKVLKDTRAELDDMIESAEAARS